MSKRNYSKSGLLLLDSFSIDDLQKWEARKENILRYHWDLYSALAYERTKAADQLRMSLLEASRPYEFKSWQRLVKYKYSLTPLSPKGSLLEPGGRFNMPDMGSSQILPFPALYIAKDRDTVLQEAGLKEEKKTALKLSSLDLALTRKDSITVVSVTGKLESVIDLHDPESLKPFLKTIKRFSIPDHIVRSSKKAGINPPLTVQRISSLLKTLLEPEWRAYCMQLNIPANCQIFGQLVANAGISGILYPSKHSKKKCLVIYPQNFDSESFITIEGDCS